jgi:hypothetical protein
MTGDCHVQFGERLEGKFLWPTHLDFLLKEPDPTFKWQPYLNAIEEVCQYYGVIPEVIDKSKVGNAIQKMFLKDTSIIKFLNLSFKHHLEQKLTIKLEIDTNPPLGSKSEIKFLDFPLASQIEIQDLSSNFSGKTHALLCRKYVKGRDWYDFLWYVSREVVPNFVFLSNAIDQQGPWASQDIDITPKWLIQTLESKIHQMDWKNVIEDVSPFLNTQERKSLKLWDVPFFMDRIEKLKSTIINLS